VADHACAACGSGETRPAGDNATGPNTACDSSGSPGGASQDGCGCSAASQGASSGGLWILAVALALASRRGRGAVR
jgi:MYXO-CTERM domain-containing protein